MKYYDKEIYKQEKKFEAVIIIICTFIIGFVVGYACIDYTIKNSVENNGVESEVRIDEKKK